MAIPTRRPGSSPNSLKAKSPIASPTWGKASSPNAAIRSRALACAPGDALVVREAGRFYYNKGDARAGRTLLRALELDPNDIMAQFFYARLLDGSGDKASAHKYYQQVLRRLPQDAEVHYYYGRSLGEAGKVFDAYLHLAYSSLYQNDKRKTESWLKQARPLARTPVEQDQLKRFEAIYAERQEVWKYVGE